MMIRSAIQALDAERDGRSYQGSVPLSEIEVFARIPETSWLLGKAKMEQLAAVADRLRQVFPRTNIPVTVIRKQKSLSLIPDLSGADSDAKLRVHAVFTSCGWESDSSAENAPGSDRFHLSLFKAVV